MDKVKIGIVGCGAIGEGVAHFIDTQLKHKAILWAVADRDVEKAEDLVKKLSSSPKILNVDNLIRNVKLVIETASVEAVPQILKKAIAFKKDVVILSVGALINAQSLIRKAEKTGIRIYLPSGAICGVDALGALGLGKIKRLSLITSKPPKGLFGAKYLQQKRINIVNLKKKKIIFKGSVKEAIKYFPQNINVAATLLLAASFRNVKVSIEADPEVKRNIHRIEVDAEAARVSIIIENVPSRINPKTSALAILSTQYLLKKIFSSFKIGS